MDIRVECQAKGARAPSKIFFNDKVIDVLEIIDRWISTDERYFKVRGSDGGLYILKHETGTPDWTLTLYDHENLKEAYDKPKKPPLH